MSYDKLIKRTFDPGLKEIKVFMLADLHAGTREYLREQTEANIQRIARTDNEFIIIGGDLLNNALKNSKSNVYEEIMSPEEQLDYMIELLRPVAGKIVCAIPGNHEYRSGKEADAHPIKEICRALSIYDKTPSKSLYRRDMAFVTFEVGRGNEHKDRPYRYSACVAHGGSRGRTAAFPSTVENLDIMFSAHAHTDQANATGKLSIDISKGVVNIKTVKHLIASPGLGYGGYAARGLYQPSCCDGNWATLYGDRKEVRLVI